MPDTLSAALKRLERQVEKRGRPRARGNLGGATTHPHWRQPKRERPRCGAKTRKGTPCQRLPIDGKKRCRNHGGLSTGAKTAKGKACVTANLAKTPSWQRHASRNSTCSR
jgi:hypothetical protein